MGEISPHFTLLDWGVVFFYLALTTWIGHRFAGKQATIRDFFLGGRKLPWPAVCGSIIATEISALTFIGVPAMVFATNGNFTYLQWAIGSVAARFIVGLWLVRLYYREEIYSPYQFIGNRLGPAARHLATGLFFVGSILGQSVRLLVTAIILRTVSGLDFHLCILLITLFAIGWAWMGGMTTVIWTDVIQFFIFIFGGIIALVWIPFHLEGGVATVLDSAAAAGKFRLLDLSTDPALGFTLWVGILAMPFQNLAAFGADQLNAQRLFCCRDATDARRAMVWSSCGQFVTMLMLSVGAGLYAYYQQHPPGPETAALFAQDRDFVFPVWITTVLPPGLTGLVLAGAFAAAISSLDSILAALAQTSLHWRHGRHLESASPASLVLESRLWIGAWGIGLALAAIALDHLRGGINMVDLAFGVVGYTYGPLLGILILAWCGRTVRPAGLWLGFGLCLLIVLWIRPEWTRLMTTLGWEFLIPHRPAVHFAWLYPVTTLLMVGICWLFPRPASRRD